MSVFGGDSWAREAQYRKRRVDDLVVDKLESDGSSYKKLPSGKYACLVCPHRPILDTPLMLSMHIKGSRHCAADSKLKEIDLQKQYEINKRIALANSSHSSAYIGESNQICRSAKKPLIERTQKAASEVLCTETPQQNAKHESHHGLFSCSYFTNTQSTSLPEDSLVEKVAEQEQSDFQERRERELKFTAAGWKRDGHGRWFRDDDVEFDSDEEDPNVYLAG